MTQFQFLVQCIVCKLQYTISDYPEVIAEEALITGTAIVVIVEC